ncbi:MAG: DUF58 domain-containing protein [bacterium]|nr:DUF58 domain-containing protein [bacterium]
MAAVETLLSNASLIELKRLELRSKRSVTTDLVGRYRSSFRGSGLMFSDLRQYEPGDDIKHIHWKVTARTGKAYVKTYEEERQLNVMLAVDISNSTNFGSPKRKSEKAFEFAALLTTLTQNTHDNIGLCLFGDRIYDFVKPSSKRTQFQRIINSLIATQNHSRGTNLKETIIYLRENLRRKSVVFLISDFYSSDFKEDLKLLAAKHDVIGVLLSDSLEHTLPSLGLVEFEDAESGERIVLDSGSSRVREKLKVLGDARAKNLRELFNESRSDLIEIKDSILKPLTQLMAQRSERH